MEIIYHAFLVIGASAGCLSCSFILAIIGCIIWALSRAGKVVQE